MAVWEDVVECVDVSVLVLEPRGDLETVGEAERVLETRAEAETVEVILAVSVRTEDLVSELLVVDVFD